ncbi:MAG: hypothetical protein J7M17_05510, partial [Anaerolineae bacterium]|nr:hypothetical protein [Anaerolineae bacterium]
GQYCVYYQTESDDDEAVMVVVAVGMRKRNRDFIGGVKESRGNDENHVKTQSSLAHTLGHRG